ncbi:MAG: hypothetical protein WAU45_23065 [Blastocatellia bacterium]
MAIDRGKIVTKLPTTSDKRELAALGVVRLNVPKEFFLEKFMDIESFKKSEIVSQIRKLSKPPRPEDLRELTLETEHVIALKNCKVGNCNVKIPARLIERFQREVRWSAPDHKERATAVTRQFLLDYVRAYLKDGNAALVEYGDRPYKQRLADEVRSMVDQSPHLLESAPDFLKYLSEFPRIQLPGVEDFIYWSKERVGGFKPVLGMTHVSVYKQRTESSFQIVIASKQIYANHYFGGSLALTWIVDAETEGGKTGSYLIYFNRSRMDALQGGLSWLKRYIARGRVRQGLVKNIQLTKEKLEGPADRP